MLDSLCQSLTVSPRRSHSYAHSPPRLSLSSTSGRVLSFVPAPLPPGDICVPLCLRVNERMRERETGTHIQSGSQPSGKARVDERETSQREHINTVSLSPALPLSLSLSLGDRVNLTLSLSSFLYHSTAVHPSFSSFFACLYTPVNFPSSSCLSSTPWLATHHVSHTSLHALAGHPRSCSHAAVDGRMTADAKAQQRRLPDRKHEIIPLTR